MSDAYTDFDQVRLAPRNARVAALMAGGDWWTPYQICEALGLRNASTAASRIRDLKASGLWDVERRRDAAESSVHRYRLRPRASGQLALPIDRAA